MSVWHVASLVGCQPFLWRSRYPYGPTRRDCQIGAQSPWTEAAWSNQPMCDGVGFTLSLSGGEETPETDCLALVEKV
jgi:hypothetical protein